MRALALLRSPPAMSQSSLVTSLQPSPRQHAPWHGRQFLERGWGWGREASFDNNLHALLECMRWLTHDVLLRGELDGQMHACGCNTLWRTAKACRNHNRSIVL